MKNTLHTINALYVGMYVLVNIYKEMDNYLKLKNRKLEDKLSIAEASLHRIKDLKSLNDVEYEVEEYTKRIKALV